MGNWKVLRLCYDKHLSNTLHFLFEQIKKGKGHKLQYIGPVKTKKDENIKIQAINMFFFRFAYKTPKYKKDNFGYPFSKCAVFSQPVKTNAQKQQIDKDSLNSTADFE